MFKDLKAFVRWAFQTIPYLLPTLSSENFSAPVKCKLREPWGNITSDDTRCKTMSSFSQ